MSLLPHVLFGYVGISNWEQVHSANSGTKKPGLLGLREIEAKKIEVETSMGKKKKKIKKKRIDLIVLFF